MSLKTLIAAAAAAIALAGCGEDAGDDLAGRGGAPPFPTEDWSTDFSRHSVPFDQFLSGGPPKDGIPAIDEPNLVSVADADGFLADREPVAVLEAGGEVRAYPLQILVWHEIVNDQLGGQPVAVTFCPLCNSTVAFDRRVDGEVLDFGTTGMLRRSDLVMYDRQTESWWQQITAEAVVGELTGSTLEVLPSQILSWGDFRELHPDADVLSRDTGFERAYGSNPYVGYDRPDERPFAYDGEIDDSLPPKERVTAVRTGSESAVVYPFSRLVREPLIEDEIDGVPVVVVYDREVASALDSKRISEGDDAGAAAVFERRLRGRTLSFVEGPGPGRFRDRQTGSNWDITGRAVTGELKGERLVQLSSDDQFWFALAAFFPKAEIRDGD